MLKNPGIYKRILSAALAMTMFITMTPTGAFAHADENGEISTWAQPPNMESTQQIDVVPQKDGNEKTEEAGEPQEQGALIQPQTKQEGDTVEKMHTAQTQLPPEAPEGDDARGMSIDPGPFNVTAELYQQVNGQEVLLDVRLMTFEKRLDVLNWAPRVPHTLVNKVWGDIIDVECEKMDVHVAQWEPGYPIWTIDSYNDYTVKLVLKENTVALHSLQFKQGENGTLAEGETNYTNIMHGLAWSDDKYAIPRAVPQSGYEFAGWQEDADTQTLYLSQDIKSRNSTITQSHSYTPIFVEQSFNLHFAVNGNGTLLSDNAYKTMLDFEVQYGESLAMADKVMPVPTADEGFYFTGWTENEIEVSPTTEQTVTDNHNYIANFMPKNTVLIKANSAKLTYNGKEQRTEGFTASADGLTFTLKDGATPLAAEFAAKNAGAYENAVCFNAVAEELRIFEGDTEVTNKYKLTLEQGSLIIDRLAVTITSGGGQKEYDGEALTNSDITVNTDFPVGEEPTYIFTGAQINCGSSDNEFTYAFQNGVNEDNFDININKGTLTVLPSAKAITITTGSVKRAYNGLPLESSEYTVSGLPTGHEMQIADERKAIFNAGKEQNTVDYKIVRTCDKADVTGCFENIKENFGVLEVTPRRVVITASTQSRGYNGEELKAEYGVTEFAQPDMGFVQGEGLCNVVVTGAITTQGSVESAIEAYELNEKTLKENYAITTVGGRLTITNEHPIRLTVKAEGIERFYDGTALLSPQGYEITHGKLAKGDVLNVVNSAAEIINAGETDNIPMVTVMRGDADVTEYYKISPICGKIKIKPRNIVITPNDMEKPYDGTPLIANEVGYRYTDYDADGNGFVEGEGIASLNLLGEITTPGSIAAKVEPGTMLLMAGTIGTNYTIGVRYGTLKISKLPASIKTIEVTANSAEKIYDGMPLTAQGYTINGKMHSGDKITVTVSGSVTRARDSEKDNNLVKSVKITHGEEDVTDCYKIVKKHGTLTVNKRRVIITANSLTRPYMGEELTAEQAGYTVSPFDEKAGKGFVEKDALAKVVQDGKILFAGETESKISEYALKFGVDKDNYEITTISGKLRVTNKESERMKLTVIAEDATKSFDGTELRKNVYRARFENDNIRLHKNDSLTVYVSGAAINVYDSREENNKIEAVSVWHDNGIGKAPEEVTEYYNITAQNGKLTILPRDITISGNSGEYVYDGKEHSVSGIIAEGLIDGYKIGMDAARVVRTEQGTANMGLNKQSAFWVTDLQNRLTDGKSEHEYSENYHISAVKDGFITIKAPNDTLPVPPVEPTAQPNEPNTNGGETAARKKNPSTAVLREDKENKMRANEENADVSEEILVFPTVLQAIMSVGLILAVSLLTLTVAIRAKKKED